MARLSEAQISAELTTKGYKLIDASKYESLNTPIIIECSHGHKIETSMADFRRPSFTCPVCDRSIQFVNPHAVAPKTGYRVIGFDQATQHFGLSVWDDGKLTFYYVYDFTGDLANRLSKIHQFVQNIVIDAWKPDFIVMEDIQQQHGAVMTYKVLAMLLGVMETTCFEKSVPYEVVSPNVWRKYAGTAGKTRQQEKLLSIAVVRDKFGINVSDDAAEAILIGQYGSRTHHQQLF